MWRPKESNADSLFLDSLKSSIDVSSRQSLQFYSLSVSFVVLRLLLTDLLYNDTTEWVGDKYDRSARLLYFIISIHRSSEMLTPSTHLFSFSSVDQTIEQVLGKVHNIRNCVISIIHHSSIFNVRWEVVSKPESSCLLAGPRFDCIAIQTVHGDNTATKVSDVRSDVRQDKDLLYFQRKLLSTMVSSWSWMQYCENHDEIKFDGYDLCRWRPCRGGKSHESGALFNDSRMRLRMQAYGSWCPLTASDWPPSKAHQINIDPMRRASTGDLHPNYPNTDTKWCYLKQ